MDNINTIKHKFRYNPPCGLPSRDIELELFNWDEIGSNHIRINNVFYEDETLRYLRTNFSEQSVILDIGAHIGNHTTYFAEFFNTEKIYAFEPHPMNYELLKRNTVKYPQVERFNIAIGEAAKVVGIETVLGNMGSVRVLDAGTIKMVPLDDLDLQQEVTMIKIDVEGYEWNVLQGGRNTIQKFKPVLVIETLSILEVYRIIRFLSFNFGYVVKGMFDDWNLVFAQS